MTPEVEHFIAQRNGVGALAMLGVLPTASQNEMPNTHDKAEDERPRFPRLSAVTRSQLERARS